MTLDSPVARREVEIRNGLGLHWRPAQRFVVLAETFKADIRVLHNGRESNGKSILDLSMLAAEQGTVLVLEARGIDAQAAVDALARLIEDRFFEDDQGEPLPEGAST